MESPESGNGAGNCSVGSIVWVRRRNGSWWPGKILGPDELLASHVISPRSGTPVKLLGREDASVDWYNLEKSKRVKAFRCGDFDDCIERAEASQIMPPKKREKYARREDAIVHALELERQMSVNKCEDVDYSSGIKGGKLPLDAVKEPILPTEYLENRNEGQLFLLTGGGKVLSSSNEHVSKDKVLYPQQVKEDNQRHVTDDDSGVIPKMGGSTGYGLRSVSASLKNPPVIPPNGSDKSLPENGSFNDGWNTNGAVNDFRENSSAKRKRSPEGQIEEESLAKRHDRHQQGIHIPKNSAKVPVSLLQLDKTVNSIFKSEEELTGTVHPAKGSRLISLTSEDKAGLSNTKALLSPVEVAPLNCMQTSNVYEGNAIESTEDTETDSSETDSLDSDSDDMASLSEGAASIELQPKYPGRSKPQQEYGSVSSDEVEDTSLPDEPCHQPLGNSNHTSTGGVVGVSRWQLKGKRNNRSLLKRPTFQSGVKFRSLLAGYNEPRSPDGIISTRKTLKRDRWGTDDHQGDSVEYFDPVIVCRQHNENRVLLIEVDLKVQSSYQRNHVPLISLMSKIDSRAMVGHSVQVEVLEDGSTDSLLIGTDDWRPENIGHDSSTVALPPTWRTARRTAKFRVPRPDLSLTYDDRPKNPRYADVRKSSQKPIKKTSKKTSSSGNQKTRTLSSIASEHRRSGGGDLKISINNNNNNYRVEGVIKPESLTTGVACIPVKLVFSRLQEELFGRHP